jgi:hypothetical protein
LSRSAGIAALIVGALIGTQVAIAQAGTTASRELGQPDFIHNASNTVDPQALNLNTNRAGGCNRYQREPESSIRPGKELQGLGDVHSVQHRFTNG